MYKRQVLHNVAAHAAVHLLHPAGVAPAGNVNVRGIALDVHKDLSLIHIFTQVLDAGYKCYCLGVHRREEMPYESLFDGFTFAGKVIACLLYTSRCV